MTLRPSVFLLLSFLLASCDATRDKVEKLEDDNVRLSREVSAERARTAASQRDLEVEKGARVRADEEVKALRTRIEELRREAEQVRKEFEDYRRRFHLESRVSAVGTKVGDLTTTEGRAYRQAVVRAVTADAVVFAHADGVSRIPIAQLPAPWAERFDFEPGQPCLADEKELAEACARALAARKTN